ncbi:MAG: hypothetical protein OEO23_17165, partial [Gemmatimonadota bacterium]|nr:hypothetical protein [Gemmatimonadota bacterium]
GVGGAHVTVRDLETSKLLAEGIQEGSTGSTAQIMETWERGAPIFASEGAGSFLAELDLSRPTRVLIEARGPLGSPHAEQFASKSLLVIPGHHVLGEGVILELNGFTVELLAPTESRAGVGQSFPVRARVTMLCGCPTEPGGLWDSDQYDIVARLVDREGRAVAESTLAFAGTTSEYEATVRAPRPGAFELQIIASDTATGNFGMAVQPLTVR